MTVCFACGQYVEPRQRYHTACVRTLFGTDEVPAIDVDLAKLHTLAMAMVGRASVSGAQRKLSADVDVARCTLHVAAGGGRYLLKPQAGTFPHLPENEWLTQRLAALAGIEVPPCALVSLQDGSLAYVVRRFDRRADGRKVAMEDFCQLSELPPGAKYDSTAERCGKLLRRYASEPLVQLLELYRRFIFNWWVGNGDLHLKNLAVLRAPDGRIVLSPAFDQLNTRLVIPDDDMAMSIDGKRGNLQAASWDRLAEHFGIGAKAARRVRRDIREVLPAALRQIQVAPLPEDMRRAYAELLERRVPE